MAVSLLHRIIKRPAHCAPHHVDLVLDDPNQHVDPSLATERACVIEFDQVAISIGGCFSYFAPPEAANKPRSAFWNRDSLPLVAISREMAAWRVAAGVLPPGLVHKPL